MVGRCGPVVISFLLSYLILSESWLWDVRVYNCIALLARPCAADERLNCRVDSLFAPILDRASPTLASINLIRMDLNLVKCAIAKLTSGRQARARCLVAKRIDVVLTGADLPSIGLISIGWNGISDSCHHGDGAVSLNQQIQVKVLKADAEQFCVWAKLLL